MTGASCLLSALVALSGAISPAQANASVPANGRYVCTTGELRAPGDMSLAYIITDGEVTGGDNCVGAVIIPEGVTKMGERAFFGATALSSITIPSSVTRFSFGVFQGATALTSITFAQGSQLTYIASNSFKYTSLTSITIPAGVTSVESNTFEGATALTSITFAQGSQLTSIGSQSFKDVTSLASITIPAGVTIIYSNAFRGATALTSITFAQDSQLRTFGNDVFRSATSLTSITIPASVTMIGYDVFCDATALKSIYFEGNAPALYFNSFGTIGSGITAYVSATATGFGTESTWYGLNVAVLYNVTYNSNGGSAVAAIEFSGSIPVAPTAPTRVGYRFDGWSATDGGNIISFPYSPTASGDITLFAKWTSDQAVAAKAAEEDRARAEEARARAVLAAQAEIRSTLISGKPLTADQLLNADFKGVTSKNIGLVNADIAKLSEADKTDLKQIEKVVLKFATVDKIANGKAFYPFELIAVGLIPEDSKIKSSITSALKKLPGSSLDTFEKIQAAVASVEKKDADRKARLATVLGKKR